MNTQILSFGLSVTVLGMVVVFVGLIVLILCVKGISLLRQEKKSDRKAPDEIHAPAGEPFAVSVNESISPEIVAAITAAIAAVWQGDKGFVVRHIKRVNNAPAWNRAGREEQTYSRF